MRPGKPFGLSAIEKCDIWSRWKAGQSLHEIGRAFEKPHSSIRCLLLPRGGIPPAARRRSRLRSPWVSEKIYLEGSLPVHRSVRLLDDWIERPAR
jgi:hypothetical protein